MRCLEALIICLLIHINVICISNHNDNFDKFETIYLVSINNGTTEEIITVDNIASRKLQEVNLTLQTEEESKYLQFHRCFDAGEVYAAAYLITEEHLLNHYIDGNLTTTNTEAASFIVFDNSNNANQKSIKSGTITQALDIFDFSVIHLSAYERLLRRHNVNDKPPFHEIESHTQHLITIANQQKQNPKNISFFSTDLYMHKLNKTVVIMPWLGSETGAGNSHIENRISYLKACFWSFYPVIPHIVVAVKSLADYTYIKDKSGLPFFQVIHLDNLPTSSSLPLATLQHTRDCIQNKSWSFDYIYFTESDQVLLWRPESYSDVYSFLDTYPRRVLIPHRLIPYPKKVLHIYKLLEVSPSDKLDNWKQMSCCMPRQNCLDRHDWLHMRKQYQQLHSHPHTHIHHNENTNTHHVRNHPLFHDVKIMIPKPSSSSSSSSSSSFTSSFNSTNNNTGTMTSTTSPITIESSKIIYFANIVGLQVALGNANFHAETFHNCYPLYTDTHVSVCP